ncbi:MAG TPA: glycosyltransferase [Longimicrobium sp.]|nr:glycosyltransferase [Longimicrobium sp.]
MRLLVVTEKCGPEEARRDGGARLVQSIQRTFGASASVMQFGGRSDASARWHHHYPKGSSNRFLARLQNAPLIADRVREVAQDFTHVVFVHVSMQFGFAEAPLDGVTSWTFPMFLTPSYRASGETVPEEYTGAERRVLATASHVLTPGHLERRQLVEFYGVPEGRIRVIPRGVDRGYVSPRVRELNGPLRLCSIGSIKPQKNTLGLLHLLHSVRKRRPGATLRVIGPVQDEAYAARVRRAVQRLGLGDAVRMSGYVPPEDLAAATEDAHLHVSAASCETFGRAIFETLAGGMPNVGRATGNAAAEYLRHVPYARFVDDAEEAAAAVDELLDDLPTWSAMAREIGELYDDRSLSARLAAELAEAPLVAVSDYDGTLFHKHDPERTRRCIEKFRCFPRRIVCSARPLEQVMSALHAHGIRADGIVAYGGGVVADGSGRVLWTTPMDAGLRERLHAVLPAARDVCWESQLLQIAATGCGACPPVPAARTEIYQGTVYAGPWSASKLRAVHRLLAHLGIDGRVRAFGDGPYDEELLAYYDGTRIHPTSGPFTTRRALELADV